MHKELNSYVLQKVHFEGVRVRRCWDSHTAYSLDWKFPFEYLLVGVVSCFRYGGLEYPALPTSKPSTQL